jgi:Lrp/AsnC family leucine-responsive transcriptional regulator
MPILDLDSIDRKILQELQANGKMSVGDLAGKVGLTASPCARRIRILEEAGVISGYAAIVSQRGIGLTINAFASIKLERQREEDLDRFRAAISGWAEVVECYLMTGQRDYLMRIVAKDLDSYETFLREKLTRLENVSSIETSFALGQIKRSSVLPIPSR